jgi:hypothetical protein
MTQDQHKKRGPHQKYNTREEFSAVVDKYLDENEGSLTITGLSLALGFRSGDAMCRYAKIDNGKFADIVELARSRVEHEIETKLVTAAHRNPSGLIFWLKNHGWTDQVKLEHSGTLDNIVRFPIKQEVGTPVVGPDIKTNGSPESQGT